MAAVESTSTSVAAAAVVNSSSNFPVVQRPSSNNATAKVGKNDSAISNDDLIDVDGVDPPRDSGIDLGLSFNENEIDEDILDLSSFNTEMDDEESWLYSTPAAKKTNDILSWLRKDVDNLDPNTRRSLAMKLELILRNKQLEKENEEEIIKNSNEVTTDVVERPTAVVRRKNTFTSDRPPSDDATVAKTKKLEPKIAQRKLTPTLTVSNADDERNVDASEMIPIPGRRSLDEMLKELTHKQADINPDLQDIKLLASMQEQDLRQCLQQLQLSNHHTQRRRTSSDRQEMNVDQAKQNITGAINLSKQQPQVLVASPKSPRPSSAGGENASSKKNYATYTKNPAIRQNTYDADDHPPAPITATPKGVSVIRHGSAAEARQHSAVSLLMVTQRDGDHQKSMPNLAISKSCDALKNQAMSASTSETGSYGEINACDLSPTGSSQKIANGHKSATSRLPTPRSRLPTPSRHSSSIKTGIPANRTNPTAASKLSLHANQLPTQPIPKNDWKDGCI